MFEEPPALAWRKRFGTDSPAELSAISGFYTHRSVRDYADRSVPESTIAALIGAAQSASTSSNLQLWSVVSVQDPDRRREIARLCADQRQVQNAPWFLAFLIDHHRLKSAAALVDEEALGLDFNEFYTMAVIDASLAAERLVCAAEHLGLGVCYIGALRNDAEGVKQVLQLPEGTFGLFGLCIGWPSESLSAEIKPRLSQSAVWFRETYGETDVSEYDDRMREFYVAQKMSGSVNWSMRSGRRVDEHHLTGRDRLRAFLRAQGFDKR